MNVKVRVYFYRMWLVIFGFVFGNNEDVGKADIFVDMYK